MFEGLYAYYTFWLKGNIPVKFILLFKLNSHEHIIININQKIILIFNSRSITQAYLLLLDKEEI